MRSRDTGVDNFWDKSAIWSRDQSFDYLILFEQIILWSIKRGKNIKEYITTQFSCQSIHRIPPPEDCRNVKNDDVIGPGYIYRMPPFMANFIRVPSKYCPYPINQFPLPIQLTAGGVYGTRHKLQESQCRSDHIQIYLICTTYTREYIFRILLLHYTLYTLIKHLSALIMLFVRSGLSSHST